MRSASHRSHFAIKEKWPAISPRLGMVAAAGFCGMFLCGGPVYLAGVTTTAINIGLIFAVAPVIVLLIAWAMGSEKIRPVQVASIAVALPGVSLILADSRLTGYTEHRQFRARRSSGHHRHARLDSLQSAAGRHLAGMSSVSRTCLFAFAGAGFSLPFCLHEAWQAPHSVFSAHAFLLYLFAGVVPKIGAYAGSAYFAAKFGSVRASLFDLRRADRQRAAFHAVAG